MMSRYFLRAIAVLWAPEEVFDSLRKHIVPLDFIVAYILIGGSVFISMLLPPAEPGTASVSLAFSVISMLVIYYVFVAMVDVFVLRIAFRKQLAFRLVLLVVLFANFVTLPRVLLMILTNIAGFEQFSLTLALLIPSHMSGGFLSTLLAQFDLFSLWSIWLTVLGFSILFELNRQKLLQVFFGIWFFSALLTTTFLQKYGISLVF